MTYMLGRLFFNLRNFAWTMLNITFERFNLFSYENGTEFFDVCLAAAQFRLKFNAVLHKTCNWYLELDYGYFEYLGYLVYREQNKRYRTF